MNDGQDRATHAPRHPRLGRLVFFALIAGLLAFLGVIAYWEPILGDGWGQAFIQQRGVDFERFIHYVKNSYLGGNPRVGQMFTLLTYCDAPVHEILTPLVEVLFLLLVFVHALGRLPQPSRLQDSAWLVVILAFCWISIPLVGPILFYRPFTTNYLYGFCFQLLFLVPYRLHLDTPRPRLSKPWFAAVMFVGGVIAGMTNEHTGPAAVAGLAAFLLAYRLRKMRWTAWMVTGGLGLVIGYLMLFFAPGQQKRYGGLAQEQSIIELIVGRGLGGNIDIVTVLFDSAAWMIGVVVVALIVSALLRWLGWKSPGDAPVSRARMVRILAYVAAATLMAGTLMASPKQGLRLYFAPMALLVIAGVDAVAIAARQRVVRWALLCLALGINAYYLVHITRIYHRVHDEFEARMTQLRAAQPDSVVFVPLYTDWRRSKWFFGDDFHGAALRTRVARRHFGLDNIFLINGTGGTGGLIHAGVRYELEYRFEPPLPEGAASSALAAALPEFSMTDFKRARQRFDQAVEQLRAVPGHELASAHLRVKGMEFDDRGDRPVYLASWSPPGKERVEVHAKVTKSGWPRQIHLRFQGWSPSQPSVFAVVMGDRSARCPLIGNAKKPAYELTPWGPATYVIVVCDDAVCYLGQAARINARVPKRPVRPR